VGDMGELGYCSIANCHSERADIKGVLSTNYVVVAHALFFSSNM
jgi:hypothetical protein